MILSVSKQFLFIHIPKCAGESMAHVLQSYQPWNLEDYSNELRPYIEAKHRLPPHLTYQGAVSMLNVELEPYFKFAFVRNPWERYVSLYTYFKRMERHVMHERTSKQSFTQFIDDVVNKRILESQYNIDSRSQTDYIEPPHGMREVDFIGRIERLEEDWAWVCKHLGIEGKLPALNMDKHGPYREYYSQASAKLVREYCAKEIELFKYSF